VSNDSFILLADTNALSSLTLYIEACDNTSKPIGTLENDILTELETKGFPRTSLNAEEVKKGYKFLDYINKKHDVYPDKLELFFSLFAEFEILKLISERVIERKFTKELISYRLRHKKFLKSKSFLDYEKDVYGYWQDMKQKLENIDIEFIIPEDSAKSNDAFKDIITIARIINKQIILDSGDLYIYAAGIYIRANEVYTNDAELRNAIHNIKENGSDEWKVIRENMISDLKNYVASFKAEFDSTGKNTLPDSIH
jgi:hypothetical protein